MIFPLVVALLTALALAVVLIPLLRRHRQAAARADYDLTVYRDQLKELESDQARGLISEEQAAAARTEIERRMLRAARARDAETTGQTSKAAGKGLGRWISIGAVGLGIPGLAVVLYLVLGAPGLPSQPFAEREQPNDQAIAGTTVSESITRLAARLEANPNDLEGWLLLSRSYIVMEQYDNAVDTLRRAAALSDENPNILAMLGEGDGVGQWWQRHTGGTNRLRARSRGAT